MKKTVLTYGLISGGILGAMMLLTVPFMDRIGFDKGMVIGYTSMVLAFLMVFFGVKSYRDTTGGGSLTFWRGFGVGMAIVAVGTVCYVATWQFVYYKLTPDFTEKYGAHAIAKARASGKSDAEVAMVTADMAEFTEMYKNPLVNIGFTFLEPLPVGLLVALVSAGVHRRKAGLANS